MTFLAVDLGATFIKAGRVDPAAMTITEVERVTFPAFTSAGGGRRELDPGRVVAAVRTQLARLASSGEPCEGVVFSSQMHGFVLCGSTGRPLGPFVSWQDQRSLEPHPAGGTYFDVLLSRLPPGTLESLGRELRPGFPVANLFHAAETTGLPPGATPVSIADFCVAQLLGHVAPCEASMASALGALRVEQGAFHHEMLNALGLDTLAWPEIVDFRQPAGVYRQDGHAVPVYASVGDQQAALLGALLADGELSLNVATGSQASRISPAVQVGEYQVRPFFGRYLDTITHIPAGRALNALLGLLAELADLDLAVAFERAEQAASALQGTDLHVDLAVFPSAVGDRGSITNLHEANMHIGDVLLAAYTAMAANYEHLARRLSPELNFSRTVVSGGLVAKSPLLRGLLIDRLGLPMRSCAITEDVLAGLLLLARVHAGFEHDVDSAMVATRRAGLGDAVDDQETGFAV